MKVTADGLSAAIHEAVFEFKEEKIKNMEELIDEEANNLIDDLKSSSPKKSGKYAQSWTKTDSGSRTGKRVTVHAKNPQYRKTHVLEKGHAKRNGGRVAAIPHIAGAEERAAQRIEKRLRSI